MERSNSLIKTNFIFLAILISLIISLTIILFSASSYTYTFPLSSKFSSNYNEAYNLGKYLAKNFPNKFSGSEDIKMASNWIKGNLDNWGYQTHIQEFKAILGKEVNLINIIAIKKGKSDEQILILTNFDQTPTSYESASDTSAAVGVVLALAHTISEEILNKTIVFAFVDGEEWGMVGASYLIENYPFSKFPSVGIIIEDLAVGKAIAISADPIGQFKGYSPLWLRELVKACSKNIGIEFIQPSGFEEYVQRAILISFTDQGPLLRYGIPSIQVGTVGDNPELSKEVYHSVKDTYELITLQAIETYTKVSECILRTLDNMSSFPKESNYYLLINENKVIGLPTLLIAQILLLTPLYFVSISQIRKVEKKEILCYLFTFLILIFSYIFAKLFPIFNIIPYYELYPPPPRHPMLYQPNYFAIITWLFVTLFLLYLTYLIHKRIKPESNKAIITNIAILSILSIISFIYNSFGATLLLLPAVYLWMFVKVRSSFIGKIINCVLIILGGTMIYLLVYVYSQRIYLDIFLMFWYLFLGVTYNLFTIESMILYISILAIGIRLLIITLKRSTA